MIFAIELKRYMANAGILSIIIGEFCYKKKPYSIILLEVDKDLEVGFHYTILSFNLAVRLRMEGSEKSPLDAKEIA